MFADALAKGAAAAGWVIGFVSAAGVFAVLMWVVIRLLIWAANAGEENHADD